ncbi:DUF4255 domain-containing protein [Phytoactinopolyspora alkaliphila]|uniref:DUF4255 domain-containing protein n=1 Tax=Phytoactinopolyspora alkaliphila TaxID=1783498 RepID=A0A6N9YFQ3_9ACTN|nr:DUF4255 domain-containing protein [Phytoactinopolyspora alkaliphila]
MNDGLENMLRATVPLPPDLGDVSFERPSGTWSAQISRVTVNLFLYGVGRSPLPPSGGGSRLTDAGRLERQDPSPILELRYLVSAWAATVRDEHRLLSDALNGLVTHQAIPAEHVRAALSSDVRLVLARDESNRPRDLWASIGGTHKASFTLFAIVAADAAPWKETATGVEQIESRTIARPSAHAGTSPAGGPATETGAGARTRRSRAQGTVVSEVAREGGL